MADNKLYMVKLLQNMLTSPTNENLKNKTLNLKQNYLEFETRSFPLKLNDFQKENFHIN